MTSTAAKILVQWQRLLGRRPDTGAGEPRADSCQPGADGPAPATPVLQARRADNPSVAHAVPKRCGIYWGGA